MEDSLPTPSSPLLAQKDLKRARRVDATSKTISSPLLYSSNSPSPLSSPLSLSQGSNDPERDSSPSNVAKRPFLRPRTIASPSANLKPTSLLRELSLPAAAEAEKLRRAASEHNPSLSSRTRSHQIGKHESTRLNSARSYLDCYSPSLRAANTASPKHSPTSPSVPEALLVKYEENKPSHESHSENEGFSLDGDRGSVGRRDSRESNSLVGSSVRKGLFVLILSLPCLATITCQSLYLPAFAEVLCAFQTSNTMASASVNAYIFAMSLSAPFSGPLIAWYGGKGMLIRSMLLAIVGVIVACTSMVPSGDYCDTDSDGMNMPYEIQHDFAIWQVIIGRAIIGAGLGTTLVVCIATTVQTLSTQEVGPALALVLLPAVLLNVPSPVLGGFLVSALSWRGPILFTGSLLAPIIAAVYIYIPPTPPERIDKTVPLSLFNCYKWVQEKNVLIPALARTAGQVLVTCMVVMQNGLLASHFGFTSVQLGVTNMINNAGMLIGVGVGGASTRFLATRLGRAGLLMSSSVFVLILSIFGSVYGWISVYGGVPAIMVTSCISQCVFEAARAGEYGYAGSVDPKHTPDIVAFLTFLQYFSASISATWAFALVDLLNYPTLFMVIGILTFLLVPLMSYLIYEQRAAMQSHQDRQKKLEHQKRIQRYVSDDTGSEWKHKELDPLIFRQRKNTWITLQEHADDDVSLTSYMQKGRRGSTPVVGSAGLLSPTGGLVNQREEHFLGLGQNESTLLGSQLWRSVEWMAPTFMFENFANDGDSEDCGEQARQESGIERESNRMERSRWRAEEEALSLSRTNSTSTPRRLSV